MSSLSTDEYERMELLYLVSRYASDKWFPTEETRHTRAGMHNIRPAEALNMARETQIFFILLVSMIKTLFECVNTYHFGPWISQKKFLALHEI